MVFNYGAIVLPYKSVEKRKTIELLKKGVELSKLMSSAIVGVTSAGPIYDIA